MQKRPIARNKPHTDPADAKRQAPNAERMPDKEEVDAAREDETGPDAVPKPELPKKGNRRPEEKGPGPHNQ